MIFKNQDLHTSIDKDPEQAVQRISQIQQEISAPELDHMYKAICRYETEEEKKEVKKRVSCVLPRTTFEFEKSSQLNKIKAIRGLTPEKDIQIKLKPDSIALLASKVFHDSRFYGVMAATRKVAGSEYAYMRMKSDEIILGSSPDFSQIIILTSVYDELTFIILIPAENARVTQTTMHSKAEQAISSFKSAPETRKRIWLP